MEYAKIQASVAGTASFRALPPAVRTVWFQACLQCAMEETGGRLRGAAGWKDGQWRAALGVAGKDATAAATAGLLRTDGTDLLVVGYDAVGEAAALKERAATRIRIANWRNGQRNASGNGDSNADVTPLHQADSGQTNGVGPASPGPSPGPGPDTHSKPSPGSSAPAKPTAAGGGARQVISALDPREIVLAIRSGDLFAVLKAYRANTDRNRKDDWLREADLLTTSTVATILQRGYEDRKPIREPSGFRVAREAWEALPDAMRKVHAVVLRDFTAAAVAELDAGRASA